MAPILAREELAEAVASWRARGLRVVTTNGAFDIVHVGHLRALRYARSLGDVLLVGVNSDASVRRYKDTRRPANPEAHRAAFLSELPWVDAVHIFDEDDPRIFLDIVKPAVHVKSGDYDPEKMIETPTVRKHGGQVVIAPLEAGYSTTSIIDRILKAYGEQ